MITGRCECGRIRYEAGGDIEDFSYCYCSQCRRLHGAAFATFAAVSRDEFRYVSGESVLKVYASSEFNDRVFCAECGSNILVDARQDPDLHYICMGTVDGDPACPVGYHAYAGSKAAWYEITDGLEQFDAEPPE